MIFTRILANCIAPVAIVSLAVFHSICAGQQNIGLTVSVNRADPQLLLRFESLLEAGKIDEAAESIALLIDQEIEGFAGVENNTAETANEVAELLIPFDAHCQLQLATASRKHSKLIGAYRNVVDLQAKHMLDNARRSREISDYHRLVRTYLLSTHGETVLRELAALHLEKRQFRLARTFLIPLLDAATVTALGSWDSNLPPFPNPSIRQPDVVARLAVISILAGDVTQFDIESKWIKSNAVESGGMLAGIEGRYVDTLEQLAETINSSPEVINRDDSPRDIDPSGKPIWFANRISEKRNGGSDFIDIHPVIVGSSIVWHDHFRIRSLLVESGKPTFSVGEPEDTDAIWKGTIWQRSPDEDSPDDAKNLETPVRAATIAKSGQWIFAIMTDRDASNRDLIVGLDTALEGKLLPGFPISPPRPEMRFVGTPLHDGDGLFVTATRKRSGSNRVAMILCRYDLPTTIKLGGLKPTWQKLICESESLDGSSAIQSQSGSLVLNEGVLYCNANLGVIAAVDALTGSDLWRLRYRRKSELDLSSIPISQRATPNPPTIENGQLFVAPGDSNDVFSIDAISGRLIWHQAAGDIDHVLGLIDSSLVCSGRTTTWLDKQDGRPKAVFPRPTQRAHRGFVHDEENAGRGWIVGNEVYLSFSDRIVKFAGSPLEAKLGEPTYPGTPRGIGVIDLASRQTGGGNLLIHDQLLIIINGKGVFAYNNTGSISDGRRSETE